MRRKVCIVTSLHEVDDGRVFERECKSLSKKYDVYFVAPNTESRDIDGVHIVGVPLPDIHHRLRRWMTLDKIIPILKSIDAEIYHFQDPELMSVGLKMKKLGKKIIFDSHEDVPRQFLSRRIIPTVALKKLASILYTKYEKWKLKNYDALVSVTPEIVDRLKRINPNTYMLTNFPIYRDVENERLWERKIVFAGLITDSWNLHRIIEAIKDENVMFNLAGFYATEEYINSLKSMPGWDKVDYLGRLNHSEVFELLSRCTVGMAIQSDDNPNMGEKKGSIGITKMYEYMMVGIPVIATNLENWIPIVEGNECGFCVNCHDVDGIKEKILYLLNNPQEAKRLGDNGKKAVKEKYNWQIQEKILFEMYDNLLQHD